MAPVLCKAQTLPRLAPCLDRGPRGTRQRPRVSPDDDHVTQAVASEMVL